MELEIGTLIKNSEPLSFASHAYPFIKHLVVARGHPYRHLMGSTLLKFGDRAGTVVSAWCCCKPFYNVYCMTLIIWFQKYMKYNRQTHHLKCFFVTHTQSPLFWIKWLQPHVLYQHHVYNIFMKIFLLNYCCSTYNQAHVER